MRQPLVALAPRLEQLGYAVSLAAAADFRELVVAHGVRFEPLSFVLGGPLALRRRPEGRGSATDQVRDGPAHAPGRRTDRRGPVERRRVARGRRRRGRGCWDALTFAAVEALRRLASRPWWRNVTTRLRGPGWPSAHGPVPRARAARRVDLAPQPRVEHARGPGRLRPLPAPGRPHPHRRRGLSAQDLSRLRGRRPPHAHPPRGEPCRRAAGSGLAGRAAPDGLLGAPRGRGRRGRRGSRRGRRRRRGSGGLEPDLEDFLAGGPPPAYVGFGSMPTADPVGVPRDVLAVLDRLGLRAVVSEGLAGLAAPTARGERSGISGSVIGVGATVTRPSSRGCRRRAPRRGGHDCRRGARRRAPGRRAARCRPALLGPPHGRPRCRGRPHRAQGPHHGASPARARGRAVARSPRGAIPPR